jgi:hypothetical protein
MSTTMPPPSSAVDEALELEQAREEELVLDDTVLDACRPGEAGQLQCGFEAGGGRLLGVDVLAGGDRLPDRLLAGRGDLGVEVDVDRVVREDGVEVGGPVLDAVLLGHRLQYVLAAADQDGLGPQDRAVAEVEAALLADGEDGADQVLAVSHPAGDAVHGDPHCLTCHVDPSPALHPQHPHHR